MPLTPSFLIPVDGPNIHLAIPQTQTQTLNTGITFNQANTTFNQTGVMFGGIYNLDEDVPLLFTNQFINDSPKGIIASQTLAQWSNPGITFNQANVTFNDPRYVFGGITNSNQDVSPSFSLIASQVYPNGSAILDFPSNNQLALLLEDGTNLLTEDGQFLLLEY